MDIFRAHSVEEQASLTASHCTSINTHAMGYTCLYELVHPAFKTIFSKHLKLPRWT